MTSLTGDIGGWTWDTPHAKQDPLVGEFWCRTWTITFSQMGLMPYILYRRFECSIEGKENLVLLKFNVWATFTTSYSGITSLGTRHLALQIAEGHGMQSASWVWTILQSLDLTELKTCLLLPALPVASLDIGPVCSCYTSWLWTLGSHLTFSLENGLPAESWHPQTLGWAELTLWMEHLFVEDGSLLVLPSCTSPLYHMASCLEGSLAHTNGSLEL